jgi:sarcosine oxidase
MSIHRVDVAIVGAGLMGSCAAWQLASRGLSVAVLEAYEVGHDHGSSHGRSRSFRRAYADPLYAAMTGLALEQWRRLQDESGTHLLTGTGGIDHGPDYDAETLSSLMTAHGVTNELLSARQAEIRWPGMRFTTDAIFHACAGVFDPESTIVAATSLAAAAGAEIMPMTRVVDANVAPSGEVALHSSGGDQIIADFAVLTTGAWLPDFSSAVAEFAGNSEPVLPPLTIRQQQTFHFALRPGEDSLPTFVHKNGKQMYGMPSGSDVPVPAMKVGCFHDGDVTTTEVRDQRITDEQRQSVVDYVSEWMPALDPTPLAESSGLITMTPDGDFILDRSGPLVVAATCSGHGAKFAPLIGSMIADLVTGAAQPTPRFQMDRGAWAH